jgi:hypothetical protein
MSGSKLSKPAENPVPIDAPLSMTVHELPPPGEVARADAARTRSGRLKMLLVLLICLAPVLASYFSFYVLRPAGGGRNFGELIQPPQDMPEVQARDLAGHSLPLRSLRGQWLLVSVSGGACGPSCEQNLYFQRQLRETQGKDKERIDRVWLIADDAPVPEALRPALAQAQVLRVDAAALQAWLQPAAGQALADHIYVVDPMGNWMMRFPPHMDVHAASSARRDLERLMRASASWDTAGR